MATRAQVKFATRESGQAFNQHPVAIHAQFYVHYDGYPEGLGLAIAESILEHGYVNGWEIEQLDVLHGDLNYVYYIWQAPEKETYISIFEGFGNGEDFDCVFVGNASKLINKYKLNTNNDR